MSDLEDIRALDDLTLRDDDGQAVVGVGLTTALYFTGGHAPGLRHAVLDLAERHLDGRGDRWRWWLPPVAGVEQVVPPAGPDLSAARRAADDPTAGIGFWLMGAKDFDRASFQMALGAEAWPGQLSFVAWTMSLAEGFALPQGRWLAEILDWCRAARPLHGTAGIGVISHPDYGTALAAQPWVKPLLERFPGLDYGLPVDVAAIAHDGLPVVNWLTVLGDPLVARLGGRQALGREIDSRPELALHDYPGGVVVQAGPVPQIGDQTQGMMPRAYGVAGGLLKDVRTEPFDLLTELRYPEDSEAFSHAWLNRFDN